jgi:glycosyltransferase involved in cell wall biosynthesis
MRFLHFSTSDGGGGAAKAAYRLHEALRDNGHASAIVVRHKTTSDPDVHAACVNSLAAGLHQMRRHLPFIGDDRARFTFNFDRPSGVRLQSTLESLPFKPDIVCLHWTSGLLTTVDIHRIHARFRCPIFLIVLDQEPVTGGCHYSFGCQGHTQQCGNCPLLSHPSPHDASRRGWERKRRHLANLPITLIAPTSWAEAKIRDSSLFKAHPLARIPLPIDTNVFQPAEAATARTRLGLPHDRPILFFGSSYLHEPRKGMAYLREALQILVARANNQSTADRTHRDVLPLLLIAGRNPSEVLHDLPLDSRWLGHLDDQRTLALAYQAADLFVCPSVEDAGPMMIPEAMLCGTPVVAFNTGGAPDLIEHGRTGFLAKLMRPEALAAGVEAMLGQADHAGHAAMREQAAAKAFSLHNPKCVADKYAAAYQRRSSLAVPVDAAA